MAADPSVTVLLGELAAGDGTVYDRVFSLVYDELRRIAGAQLARERPGHTVSPTVLVHEAYLDLVDQTRATFASRAHFLSVAALAMRRILVDHAVARRAAKRGGGERVLTFDEQVGAGTPGLGASFDDVLAVDRLLDRLAEAHPRPAQVVVCRVFGGLTDAEIAGALDIAVPTVRRDWRFARAWLTHELGRA